MAQGFFRRPGHRVFEYKPRHFDPEKEEREQRIKELEEKYSGKKNDPESIKSRIALSFKREKRSEARSPMMIRMFIIVLIVTLIYAFFVK